MSSEALAKDIIRGDKMFDIPIRPTCVHHFVEENAEALQNAALLLGGRPWLKRVQCLFDTLYTGNSLHGS